MQILVLIVEHNTKFERIIDEIGGITYIKKYDNLFDSQVANFVKSDILEQNINMSKKWQ